MLILCVGVLLGLLLSGVNINSLSGWKDWWELFSYIATVATACFAIWTLGAWRAQFGFEKRFATLKDLSDSFEDLRVVFTHLGHIKAYWLRKSEGIDDADLAEALDDLERTGLMWDSSITRYAKTWRSSLFFISVNQLESLPINPNELRTKVKNDLTAVLNEIDGRTGPPISIYISFKLGGIHNELVEIFREADVQLYKIIKQALTH
jgi:hypothetical protein